MRNKLKNAHRIVIKVGTNSIMNDNQQVNLRQLDRLSYVISALMQEGKECILVSSGAIGVGASMMKVSEYPQSIPDQQALSAIGQTTLMSLYQQFFRTYGQTVGQILFTRDVIDFPQSYENVQNSLSTLLARKVVPIINENDAVSVDEMNHKTVFGDNDTLSALVAQTVEADLLIILSDVAGLYDSNPSQNPQAQLIDHVSAITDDIRQMAAGKGSEFSTGGMSTKLNAAEIVLNYGGQMVIFDASQPSQIFDLLDGQAIGTLFSKGE